MKLRIALFCAVVGCALGVIAGPRAEVALACDQTFWNIPVGDPCQFYTPNEGHSELSGAGAETVYASWSVYNHMMMFSSFLNGSWSQSAVVENSPNAFRFVPDDDKVGCFNHNTGTKFVNCRHYDS